MTSQRSKDYEEVNNAFVRLATKGPRSKATAESARAAFNRIAFDHGQQAGAVARLRAELPKSWLEEAGITEDVDDYSREAPEPNELNIEDLDEDDEDD